ncbi:MAG TPA: hypothetical protein VG944_18635 [Fimbriimonas sp.]|nr:hypothetical protein [Fimbriimonas sp.]
MNCKDKPVFLGSLLGAATLLGTAIAVNCLIYNEPFVKAFGRVSVTAVGIAAGVAVLAALRRRSLR